MSADSQSSTVGTWALAPCQEHPAENTFTVGLSPEGDETSLADDSRKPVDDKDIQPGGKYYSIVKLQIRYENQEATDDRWAQGSGWLVKPNVLVTAGHCAFDHTYQLGRATQVKVYVGYKGKESIGTAGVQFRHVSRVLTTSGWLKSDVNRQNDVSVMLLETPFDNVRPFTWQSTPTTGTKVLGVVGYPADKTYKDEAAARMYAQFKQTNFDLSASYLSMLEYKISSYGGQSGSPVIVEGTNSSIGTHVYGLGVKNSASVIRGQYGNFYRSYINAISGNISKPEVGTNWTVLNLPAAEDALTEATPSDAEDFWDTLKKVAHVGASVGSTVLGVASPFLGPIGAPIAAVAGGALGVLGKATESAMAPESATGDQINSYSYKEPICRGILSEAALDAVLKMDANTAAKYGVFEHMQKRFNENKHAVPLLATKIGPALMGPALRIALDGPAAVANQGALPALPNSATIKPAPNAPQVEGEGWLDIIKTGISIGGAVLGTAGNIINKVTGESAMEDPQTEGFFDSIIGIAMKAAPIAINAVGGIINAVSGESAMEPSQGELQPHIETICHRAIMGDAALEALMRIPPDVVKQEGFLGDIMSKVKSIGATVLKVAPSVIRVVEPIAHQLIQQHLNPGSSGESAGLGPARRTLRSKKSTMDLLADESSVAPPPMPKIPTIYASNKMNIGSGFARTTAVF